MGEEVGGREGEKTLGGREGLSGGDGLCKGVSIDRED